jgi:hypothetical protein
MEGGIRTNDLYFMRCGPRAMLQVPLMSILSPFKNDVTIKIIIELVIDHY